MVFLITDLSKYAFIILIALYTSLSYSVLRKRDQEEVRHGFRLQILNLFLIHALAFVVLYMQTGEMKLAVFYAFQFFLLQAVLVFTRIIYPKANRLVLNNMCLLLAIGFIMLTRLSYDKAVRQFQIAAVALAVALIVPVLIRKCGFLQKLPWLYGIGGLALLMAVAVVGKTTSGAKLSLVIGKFVFQPSEFVKITFVFFVAAAE